LWVVVGWIREMIVELAILFLMFGFALCMGFVPFKAPSVILRDLSMGITDYL
jgi:hypothetical protein